MPSHKQTPSEVIDQMEGQTLYELYVRGIQKAEDSWGGNISSVTTTQGVPRPYFGGVLFGVQWKYLSTNAKAFWQELAQDFLKVAK